MKYYGNELYHFGILGQKWGQRRYQYEDGSLTPAGREHYGIKDKNKTKTNKSKIAKAAKIGVAVAGTALAAYGAYKLSDLIKVEAPSGTQLQKAYKSIGKDISSSETERLKNAFNSTSKGKNNIEKISNNIVNTGAKLCGKFLNIISEGNISENEIQDMIKSAANGSFVEWDN